MILKEYSLIFRSKRNILVMVSFWQCENLLRAVSYALDLDSAKFWYIVNETNNIIARSATYKGV